MRPVSGTSLPALADDPRLQLAAVATGPAAFAGGVGPQLVWLLVLVAVVVSRLVGSPEIGTGPGGHGGGGGLDRPLDTTPVPPAGSGIR